MYYHHYLYIFPLFLATIYYLFLCNPLGDNCFLFGWLYEFYVDKKVMRSRFDMMQSTDCVCVKRSQLICWSIQKWTCNNTDDWFQLKVSMNNRNNYSKQKMFIFLIVLNLNLPPKCMDKYIFRLHCTLFFRCVKSPECLRKCIAALPTPFTSTSPSPSPSTTSLETPSTTTTTASAESTSTPNSTGPIMHPVPIYC